MTAVLDILKIRLLAVKNLEKNSHNLMGEKKELKRNQGLLCIIIVRNVKTLKNKREMRNSFS